MRAVGHYEIEDGRVIYKRIRQRPFGLYPDLLEDPRRGAFTGSAGLPGSAQKSLMHAWNRPAEVRGLSCPEISGPPPRRSTW